MAKAAAVKIVRVPTPVKVPTPMFRGKGKRAFGALKRGAGAVAARVRDEKHTFTAIVAAAVLGLVEAKSPETVAALSFGPLGPAAAAGLLAWGAARFTKSKVLEHVATGLLCVAAHNMSKSEFGETSGDYLPR